MKLGITTCIRKKPTLEITLNSLVNSGFCREEIHIAEDREMVGAWPNWYKCLSYLYENSRDPHIAIVQDDVIVASGLAEYLSLVRLPAASILSVFSPSKYVGDIEGWYEVVDPSLWMAQFLIIERESAKEILESQIVWSIRGTKQIDNRLGLWAYKNKKRICFHMPSLAEHIGETSTLWPGVGIAGQRKSHAFKGMAWNCLELLSAANRA